MAPAMGTMMNMDTAGIRRQRHSGAAMEKYMDTMETAWNMNKADSQSKKAVSDLF